jgi:uncharacterized protein YndB with AHSA1/START domain
MPENRSSSANDGTRVELPSDREILITRSFAAPARIVFEAMSKPEYVRKWWAPQSRGEMLVCEIDFRVGGAWRYVMRANSGFEVGFSGKFLEIVAPTRVVQTEIFDPFPDLGSVVTAELAEYEGATTLTSRCLYPSKEVRDQVLASGMEDGMRESYRQLSAVVSSLAQG